MAKLSAKPREARNDSRREAAKPARRVRTKRDEERSTLSEAESSDAPRKRYTKKDEPEDHTRLLGGKKGHVTY